MITIGDLTIDAVITSTHNLSAEISEYPTEGGRNIVDHKRVKPLMINLECVISDAPLGAELLRQRQAETAGVMAPSAWAYQQLERMHRSGEIYTIVTPLRTYENMALVDLSITRDVASGRALAFTVSAQQVEFASVARVVVGKPTDRGLRGAKVNRGALYGTQTVEVNVLGTTVTPLAEPLKVYNNGTKAKPKLVYADGTPFSPKVGTIFVAGDTPPVVVDRNNAGATPKRAPNGYNVSPSGRRWPHWN